MPLFFLILKCLSGHPHKTVIKKKKFFLILNLTVRRCSTFSFRMLTSKSCTLVDGAICCSLSSSGSTLPNQEVMSQRSEFSFCHCSRSCLMSVWPLVNFCACSSSQRSITPAERRTSAVRHISILAGGLV